LKSAGLTNIATRPLTTWDVCVNTVHDDTIELATNAVMKEIEKDEAEKAASQTSG
jgi:hypothetical protein